MSLKFLKWAIICALGLLILDAALVIFFVLDGSLYDGKKLPAPAYYISPVRVTAIIRYTMLPYPGYSSF